MKNYSFSKKIVLTFWTLFYILIFSLLLNNSFSYLDPDLGWHLRAGEDIAITKSVNPQNFYNHSYTGDWVNHEWLGDYLSFFIFKQLGYFWLNIFFVLLILVSLLSLTIITYRRLGSRALIPLAILQLLGVLASLPHLGVRLQEFSWLLLILELGIVSHWLKTRQTKLLLLLPPLFLLWANLHGSFLFGLALLGLLVVIAILEKIVYRLRAVNSIIKPIRLSNQSLLSFSACFLLSGLATLINPYNLKLYSFLTGYRNTAYLNLIQEWLPPYVFPIEYFRFIYLGILIFALISYFKKARQAQLSLLNSWQVVLIIISLGLFFMARRFFPLVFIITLLPLLEILVQTISTKLIPLFQLNKLTISLSLVVLGLSASSLLLSTQYTNDPFFSYCDKYPCQAITWLKDQSSLDNYQLFNSYGWGGYLAWTLPELKTFIDGRLPQLAINDHTFIEEYFSFFNEEENLEKKLADYHINLVLISQNEFSLNLKKWEQLVFSPFKKLTPRPNHLLNYLTASPNWQLIYTDSSALVFSLESQD